MSKKPRGEAVLKNLPDALQEALWQHARRHTFAQTRAWLATTHEVDVSESTLSVFFAWYPRSLTLRAAARTSDQLEATLRKLPELKITAEQARSVAQVNFEIQAAQDRDSKLFTELQYLDLKRREVALAERKMVLLEAKAAQAEAAERTTRNTALTPAEREAEYKRIFGMS